MSGAAEASWELLEPEPVLNGRTKPYGFVVDHHTYWGIPIPGFEPAISEGSAAASAPMNAPKILKLTDLTVGTSKWTGGDFSFLATRTPPLFHALHHKTNEYVAGAGGHGGGHPGTPGEHFVFELRAETNVQERSFSPRGPLPGRGRFACVELFSARFDRHGKAKPPIVSPPIKFLEEGKVKSLKKGEFAFWQFDTQALVKEAHRAGYFETRHMSWDHTLVQPLNALWFVFLQADRRNTPLERLGGGYRLWHRLDKVRNGANTKDVPDGYDWKISRDKTDPNHFKFEITLSGKLNKSKHENGKGPRAPQEGVTVSFELRWK